MPIYGLCHIPSYRCDVIERSDFSLVLLLAGDAARMMKPPVSTESIRRWTLQGKLKSIAQLSDGTRLFLLADVQHFNEMRQKLKLTDSVLSIGDAEGAAALP